MPKKKKTTKKVFSQDFTINDSANALKPVTREKKTVVSEPIVEESWDSIDPEEFDIVEEINDDGTRSFRCKKTNKKEAQDHSDDQIIYPEIVWYLISRYIRPEDVARFAGINKATYAITMNESFWRKLYRAYCENNRKLPVKLRLENSYTVYGLRQRVIRALHNTYEKFIKKHTNPDHQRKPHDLIKRYCTSVWYTKGPTYWSVWFKFKEIQLGMKKKLNFIEELGRIDANPDENSQVLQVRCATCCDIPPLMGMTLSSVKVVLQQELKHFRLQLGFNSGHHNVSRNILPECYVVLDSVFSMTVLDWWHPRYPHFDNRPLNNDDEKNIPVLKKDFFETAECDL